MTGSEEMSLVQLYVHTEVAHDTVAELAALGNTQFKDVSWNFLFIIPALTRVRSSAQPRGECLPAQLRW
jgi:hypothetical protein